MAAATDSAQAAVERLLGSQVRCTLSDGRTAAGRLICIDRMKNLILADCVETRWISSRDYNPSNEENEVRRPAIRRLQQAMVPGEHLVKVEITNELYQSKVVVAPVQVE